jgi:dTDP-4-amino-4,6-dideoxygalactose transaminase
MVDTKTQYLKIKEEVDAAIHQVLDSAAYINGTAVSQFANNLAQYVQAAHCIPCANGTDALQIAFMALGLKPDDEVITPSFTYIATTEAVALLGVKPVFVDVDENTFCICPEAIRKAITPKTKAIVPVHLYGQAAPMEQIMQIAQEHNLYVIEDNAQAIDCNYTFSNGTTQKTGTIGNIGCTSFYPSKNLGAFGDGGAIFCNDNDLSNTIKMIANHGQSKRYYHDIVGVNSRLDSIQAAVLNCKLKYLSQYTQARQKVAEYYNTAFAHNTKLITPTVATYTTHVFHQYTLQLIDVDRDGLIQYLAQHHIPAMIYYPVPCHQQKMFEAFNAANVHLPVTHTLCSRVISLPIHTEMDEEQLAFICQKVLDFVQ